MEPYEIYYFTIVYERLEMIQRQLVSRVLSVAKSKLRVLKSLNKIFIRSKGRKHDTYSY